jgi:hypothetical protein
MGIYTRAILGLDHIIALRFARIATIFVTRAETEDRSTSKRKRMKRDTEGIFVAPRGLWRVNECTNDYFTYQDVRISCWSNE